MQNCTDSMRASPPTPFPDPLLAVRLSRDRKTFEARVTG